MCAVTALYALADKDSKVYEAVKARYNILKVILTSSGIHLTDIDSDQI